MARLALRFISGKYKGREYLLEDGKTIVLGRSSDADVVLLEDMVSRRHTLMTLEGDTLQVSDNGSTNGTFVNGEKISTATACKGDRILVGTSILKVVEATDATEALDTGHPTINSSLGKSAAAEPSVPIGHHPAGNFNNRTTMHNSHSGARSMSGTITEVPLPDLLQLFSTSKKTGTLVLNYNFTIAKIHLENGNIVYASISDQPGLDPLKAMFRILSWEDGDFDLVGPEPQVFPSRIDLPTEHILMEGMRQLDELRREQSRLPPADTPVLVAHPLDVKLSQLKEGELDVFQIVLNAREISVQSIINASEQSDKEAAETLSRLIKQGYLVLDDLL